MSPINYAPCKGNAKISTALTGRYIFLLSTKPSPPENRNRRFSFGLGCYALPLRGGRIYQTPPPAKSAFFPRPLFPAVPPRFSALKKNSHFFAKFFAAATDNARFFAAPDRSCPACRRRGAESGTRIEGELTIHN
jgi:hypothetical protein